MASPFPLVLAEATKIQEQAALFDQGYMAACCNLVWMFDQPSMAEELLQQVGSLNADQIRTLVAHFKATA